MLLTVVCTLGQVRIEHEMAMSGALMPFGRERRLSVIMGLPTVDARNLACKMAVDAGAEFLMFWDDDVVPRDKTAVQHMVGAMEQIPAIDVLGGVYPRRGAIPQPIVVKEEDGGTWWGWEEGSVHPVYMTGTGFTVIRVSSLPPVPQYDLNDEMVGRYFDRSAGYTDDFFFADICKTYGLRWCVDGAVICDQIDLDGTKYTVERAKILS